MEHDITVYKGTSWSTTIIWTDIENNPVDLTGASAEMDIRTTATSPDTTLQLSDATGEITLMVSGTINLNLTSLQTDMLPVGICVYDLLVTRPSPPRVDRLLGGSFKVLPTVTRNE